MKIPTSYITNVIEILLRAEAIKATKFLNDKQIIRAVRKTYGKRKPRINENIEIILTIGKPNYIEREFIKLCKKAKEQFPIKKVQLKFYKIKK